MEHVDYLLIGGGPASCHAARQIRKRDSAGRVMLAGAEPWPPYDRPPLSKGFLRGETGADALYLEPESAWPERAIELALGTPVVTLDAKAGTATLADGRDLAFGKALLATGGRPLRLPLEGGELNGVHYLRTIDDARALAVSAARARQAVVVGAGFIGLEVAASLTQMGLNVTVIEAADRIWPRFADEYLAGYIHGYCQARGITFYTGDPVAGFSGGDSLEAAHTESGRELPCQLACVGVGIVPGVELARGAGLELDPDDGGIRVDGYMHSSATGIYAAGDVVNYPDPLFERRRRVEHWGHAEYTGQIAGQNMAGGEIPYNLLTYVWSDLFDLHLDFAGDESRHDTVLVRGTLEQGSFTLLYLHEGVLTGYAAINTDHKEYAVLQRLIRKRIPLDSHMESLEDPEFDLRQLKKA